MKAQAAIKLIQGHEDWLMRRILEYAKRQGYAEYTSTLEEAWRLSIKELSRVICESLPRDLVDLELRPEIKYEADPASAFGILEADRHRERGTPLGMFLAFYKYYLQTYLDLLKTLQLTKDDEELLALKITRIFDRVELG